MKLEEVLPAMREGRVAVANGLHCYRFHDGALQWKRIQDESWKICGSNILCSPNDKWRLEPEPKVEWPKGSLGWACEQVGKAGFIKRSFWKERTLQVYFSADLSLESATALDWEVVP